MEDLLSNNYKSTPRNKKIADFFKDLGLIEKYGSGIQRIIGYFKEEKRPLPEFRNISDGFMVTVFSADSGNDTETVEKSRGEKVGEKVTQNQQIIINCIIENPYVTIADLSSMVGISTRKIEMNIQKLKTKGLIRREGADKGGYWEVRK